MQSRIFALQLFLVAALGIALPISVTQAQRNRLFALLREGERRYRVLAENATDIVMSMALDGRLTYVSPCATEVMGITPEGLVGMYYPDLVLPDECCCHHRHPTARARCQSRPLKRIRTRRA